MAMALTVPPKRFTTRSRARSPASAFRDVMHTSAPALANSPAARIPTGPVPATIRTRLPRTSPPPAACTILATAATAVVLEPFESSIADTVKGLNIAFVAAASSCSPTAMSAPPLDMAFRRLPESSSLVRATRERMRRRLRLGDHLVDLRLPLEGALDRFLHRPIVEVVDLLVVLRLPVDEHPHQDAIVVHFVPRDDARRHAVDHRTRDRCLRRAEHLHGLRGVLDGDLVEEERVGLRRQVGRDDGEQLGETVGVVRQRADESLPRVARLRPDDQIDVGDLIPVAYQRLAKEEIRCHNYLPIRMGSTSFTAGRHECGVESSAARGVWKAAPSRVCG